MNANGIDKTLTENAYYEDLECPLCMEEIDVTDKYFKPCPCGYQICRFCWNHIKEDLNSLCPACRRMYSNENVEFKPVSPEELAKIKSSKKKKEREKKETDLAARKQLANVRVVQKNLVYVLGLPSRLAAEETLKGFEYFGQYGKISKIVINKRGLISSTSSTPHIGVYITFARKEDATKAIEAVDGSMCDSRMIRATYGTTKYCSFFLKGQQCMNAGCQFLHEPGEEADSFTKDELIPQSKVNPKPNPFPVSSHGPTFKSVDDLTYTKELGEGGSSALPQSAGWAIKKTPGDDQKFPIIPPPTKKSLAKNHDNVFVQPLSYIAASPSSLVLSLVRSSRQPKYTGPFDPFREALQYFKPISNMQVMDFNQTDSKENKTAVMRSDRLGAPNDSSTPMTQVMLYFLRLGRFSVNFY